MVPKKIDKPLATLTKRREKTQITKIHDDKGNIRTDTTEVHNIMRSYFENLYSNKIETTEDFDEFLETYAHSKLNQDIHNINRSVSSDEIEETIKNLPFKKSPEADRF